MMALLHSTEYLAFPTCADAEDSSHWRTVPSGASCGTTQKGIVSSSFLTRPLASSLITLLLVLSPQTKTRHSSEWSRIGCGVGVRGLASVRPSPLSDALLASSFTTRFDNLIAHRSASRPSAPEAASRLVKSRSSLRIMSEGDFAPHGFIGLVRWRCPNPCPNRGVGDQSVYRPCLKEWMAELMVECIAQQHHAFPRPKPHHMSCRAYG